eukprot:365700-Chlamydomonas_euryale.AAC.9
MLRRAAESLLRPQLGALAGVANGASASQLLAAARYSNTVPDDYSLVMHKAAEVTNAAVTRTDTAQIGKCAGVPMETYKRPVSLDRQGVADDASIYATAGDSPWRTPNVTRNSPLKVLSAFIPQLTRCTDCD